MSLSRPIEAGFFWALLDLQALREDAGSRVAITPRPQPLPMILRPLPIASASQRFS